MKLAIVILNWNGKKMLEQYLPSVIKYSSNYADIFVADNASTDDSIKMLESKFPEIKIIALNKNFGFAEGYNQALKEIEAEKELNEFIDGVNLSSDNQMDNIMNSLNTEEAKEIDMAKKAKQKDKSQNSFEAQFSGRFTEPEDVGMFYR